MASEEDSSVISNVIFFHATLAPIDGGRGMIMPHQYKRTTTSNEILFALGISLWICMAAEPMTFFVTHARASSGHDELCAIDYESWWLFWKKLRCRPSYTDTREKNNARTSIQVCSCTRSQVAARLVLNLNFTVLSLSWKMMMLLTLSNLKSDNWLMHLVRIIKNANKAAPLRTLMSSKNKHPT